jgi:hypothetical protein
MAGGATGCGAVGRGAAGCGARDDGAAEVKAAPWRGKVRGAMGRGAAAVRHRGAWRGSVAAPWGVARHRRQQRLARLAWGHFKTNVDISRQMLSPNYQKFTNNAWHSKFQKY